MLLQVFFLLLNMEKMLVPITFSFVNFTKEPFFRRKLRQVKIHVISLFLSLFVFFHFFVPKNMTFYMVKHQNSLSRSLEAIVLASCFLKNKKKFTWTVRRLLTNLLQHILVELFWWLYAKCKYERKTRTTKKYSK